MTGVLYNYIGLHVGLEPVECCHATVAKQRIVVHNNNNNNNSPAMDRQLDYMFN